MASLASAFVHLMHPAVIGVAERVARLVLLLTAQLGFLVRCGRCRVCGAGRLRTERSCTESIGTGTQPVLEQTRLAVVRSRFNRMILAYVLIL